MTTQEILGRLDGVSQSGAGFVAKCPAHNDHNPSLSICEASDGKTLLKCHAGCDVDAITTAIGLRPRDLFPESRRGQSAAITSAPPPQATAYEYLDEYGQPLFRVVRTRPKGFYQQRRENGRWVKGLNGQQLPLFNLPAVVAAVHRGDTVLVVEGERDCITAENLGFVATTNAGGAGKWRACHTKTLIGADVVVIADNDEPGWKHALEIARALTARAASVRLLSSLPGVGPKGDLTDYVDAGNTREDLNRLIEAVPKFHDSRSPQGAVVVSRDSSEGPVPMWGFEEPPALRWFVEDVIPEGFPTILAADGGTGKSYLALYLAACVILERPFFGLGTLPGNVLYVDYELDQDEQRRRWLRILRGLGLDQHNPAIRERFHYFRPTQPLSRDAGHDQVLSAKAACDADLIVLDSLTIAMQADASAQRDVVPVMGRIREWGTVLAIDHISGAAASGNQSRARPFGSIFKRNIARSVLNLTRVDGGGRMLRATKTNFGSPTDLVALTFPRFFGR